MCPSQRRLKVDCLQLALDGEKSNRESCFAGRESTSDQALLEIIVWVLVMLPASATPINEGPYLGFSLSFRIQLWVFPVL